MQANSTEFSTDLIFWKKTWSKTLRVRKWDTSVVNSSDHKEIKWATPTLRNHHYFVSFCFSRLVPYMTAWRSTSFGLSMATSWGETVSCQFWPSHASSSRATQSGSRAKGDSILLHSHICWHKITGRGDGPISLSTDVGRCTTFEVGKFFMRKGSQHPLLICTSAHLIRTDWHHMVWTWRLNSPASRPRSVWGCRVL